MKFVVIPPEEIGQVSDQKSPASGRAEQAKRLTDAAQAVQDVAYSMASALDDTTMTELLVTSRKLERLASRVEVVQARAAADDAGEGAGDQDPSS